MSSVGIKINNATRYKIPRIAFADIKNYILGIDYDLTLNIISPEEIKELNLRFREKDMSTDILSFPLDKKSGEIYMSFDDCEKMRHDFDRTFDNFIAFLFIHGCTHLKGHDHGRIMDGIEARARKHFGV
jgi:probable rRNA maturation factor